MRQLTSLEIEKLKIFTVNTVEFTLIEPTETGLSKSILDATGPIRLFLKSNHLHDYSDQKQGPEYKIQLKSSFITDNNIVPSIASLYRPITKRGDPRIWFKGLNEYARPNDIIAIIAKEENLILINVTKLDVISLFNKDQINPLKELLQTINHENNEIAEELLMLLRKISAKGPIPSELKADTAVGRTLETLLGIAINSSKKPDYKGIEIKSFRNKRSNRKNLFAQVPNWELSKFKSSAEILSNFGYYRGVDYKLYCTVSTLDRNPQGLKLNLDNKINHLLENSVDSNIGDFVVWALETLHNRLLEKHNETFWISADSLNIDGKEHFLYKKVEHTKKPIISQFDILLEQGIITLDHLIKKTPDGKVIEKGPLFKIKPNSVGLLFPPSNLYNLC